MKFSIIIQTQNPHSSMQFLVATLWSEDIMQGLTNDMCISSSTILLRVEANYQLASLEQLHYLSPSLRRCTCNPAPWVTTLLHWRHLQHTSPIATAILTAIKPHHETTGDLTLAPTVR